MKIRRMKRLSGYAMLTTLTAACGKGDLGRGGSHGRQRSEQPVVAQVVTKAEPSPADLSVNPKPFVEADRKAASGKGTPASTAVSGRVVFRKDRLFDREFLYGFDLQYSGGNDTKYSLIPQAQSLGHLPCFFRRLGGSLQVVANQTRLYESNINHPELLIATYKVLSEDDATLTVEFVSGGLVMNEVMNGVESPNADGSKPTVEAPKQVWIRSLTFVPEGEYLLQESALQLKNGTVQTFMESVFPRDNLIHPDTVGLEANAQTEPAAARFRLLGAEEVYVPRTKDGDTVRAKTSFASRFALRGDQTIDWYVTANAPDMLMPIFKSGVEGWNRYFVPELGRPVMRFMGRLPDGISIGDPRYNVINFDSVAQAGAAYESQATDPLTGVQSHSLIYFPYAWYNIGVDLWKKRSGSVGQASADELRSILSPKAPRAAFGPGHRVLACVRSMDLLSLPLSTLLDGDKGADAVAAGHGEALMVPDDVKEFAQRLMISTLFHEVGHSLGLAHNFKGSLALDASKAQGEGNPASWSIMDYNYYQNEQDIFKAIGGTEGPLLEYDRQAISQLYHDGKDIKPTDPVLPACEDGEADTTDGGVDPFCLRYDAENDPTLGLAHAYHNMAAAAEPQGISAKTLTQALTQLQASAADKFSSAARVSSAAELDKASTALVEQVAQLIDFYVTSGAQALRNNLNDNAKALHVWKPEVKTDEAAFRGRYAQVLTDAMALRALPKAPAQAVAALAQTLLDSAAKNPGVGASDAARLAAATKASGAFTTAISARIVQSLSKMRTGCYPGLAFDVKNPVVLQITPGGAVSHYEDLLFSVLSAGVLIGLDPALPPEDSEAYQAERLVAAKALASYKSVAPGFDKLTATLQAVYVKAAANGQTQLVHDLRLILAALS